jgi:hypothetical protein
MMAVASAKAAARRRRDDGGDDRGCGGGDDCGCGSGAMDVGRRSQHLCSSTKDPTRHCGVALSAPESPYTFKFRDHKIKDPDFKSPVLMFDKLAFFTHNRKHSRQQRQIHPVQLAIQQ